MPAGLAATVEDDLLSMTADEPRTATFYRRTPTAGDPPTSGGVTLTGVHVVTLPGSTSPGGGAVLPGSGARFHAQAKQLGYVPPNPGDVIRDDRSGARYSIDECHVQGAGTQYVITGVAEAS